MATDYMTDFLERLGNNAAAAGVTQDPYANVTPEQAYQVASFAPGTGEAIGAKETYDAAKQGNYLEAGIIGAATLAGLPFGLFGMSSPVRQGVKTALTKAATSLDLLKTKPKPIAPDADVSKTRELLGVTDESTKEWKKNVSDPHMMKKYGSTQNKPPQESIDRLVEQARLLDEGKISTNDFRTFVDTNFPYYFHEAVPEIRSMKENALALGKKVDNKGILGLNRYLPEGAETQIRFDINAYRFNDIYTSTLYEGFEKRGKLHSYAQTGALKDVTFPVDEKLVEKSKEMAGIGVDKPKEKSPVVRMKGYWVEHSPEELREIAIEALEQNKNLPLAEQEWVQVGINPAKGASWVALEKTADGVKSIPITGASEVIQIGKLVLAKNPKFKSWDDYFAENSFSVAPAAIGTGTAATAIALRPEESMAAQDDEMYSNPLLRDPFDYVTP